MLLIIAFYSKYCKPFVDAIYLLLKYISRPYSCAKKKTSTANRGLIFIARGYKKRNGSSNITSKQKKSKLFVGLFE